MKSNNPAVLNYLFKSGAKVDAIESETGNNVLFLAAVDLKVDFVELILSRNPNIKHTNKLSQNITQFLKFQLHCLSIYLC